MSVTDIGADKRIFLRKASGLIRTAGLTDTFIYNLGVVSIGLGVGSMLYCGGSTPTPWDTEREYTEEQYVKRFAELLPQVGDMSRCIFNVHVPPFGTALDACPKLDKNLQVVYEMGLPAQIHAGCQTLIDIIKEHQPLLGLHGHIHEGRAKINIGKTICINPGSVYPEGILQGALITLRDGQVTQANLMQG